MYKTVSVKKLSSLYDDIKTATFNVLSKGPYPLIFLETKHFARIYFFVRTFYNTPTNNILDVNINSLGERELVIELAESGTYGNDYVVKHNDDVVEYPKLIELLEEAVLDKVQSFSVYHLGGKWVELGNAQFFNEDFFKQDYKFFSSYTDDKGTVWGLYLK